MDADPEGDLEGLRRLALWAGRRYSPVVAADPPDGIWIDITGCAHLHDGEVPTRDAKHMTKLLAQRLDTVDPGMGIEAMTLVASLVQPMAASQMGSVLTSNARGPDLAAIIDTLANRFGARQLYRSQPHESTMPEREVRYVPALASSAGAGWDDDLPRPSRMIVPPEPVEVMAMMPDHPPAMFIWRGKRHRVTQADGPERLHCEWWREGGHEADTPQSVRDYFQVETTSGGRYWLFRLGDGERASTGPMKWYIHGAFA